MGKKKLGIGIKISNHSLFSHMWKQHCAFICIAEGVTDVVLNNEQINTSWIVKYSNAIGQRDHASTIVYTDIWERYNAFSSFAI